MFVSRKELLDKIKLRKDTSLEVKEVRFSGHRVTEPHRDSYADSIAAFKHQGARRPPAVRHAGRFRGDLERRRAS